MLLAQSTPPPRYELATLAPWIDQPGVATLAGVVALAVVAVIVLQYWRERASLSPLRLLALLLLRVGAVGGVALYALAPEKRDAQEEVRASRVLVLVDDSLSMALPAEIEASPKTAESRVQAAIRLLDQQGLIAALQERHEVHLACVSEPRFSRVAPAAESTDPGGEAKRFDFEEWLMPRAADTRLGDALLHAAAVATGAPLAGVVLMTDGQNNAGVGADLAAGALGELGVAVHTIGQGGLRPAKNVAVRDLAAPRRAYPKDELSITAMIESREADGASARVSLFVRGAGDETSPPMLLESQSVGPLSADQMATAQFTVTPETQGRYEYRVQVDPLDGEADRDDNARCIEVMVVDRLLKVLLIAGGPTRDYHFLRDQLRRDDAFEVDVLLQSAPGVISQDANRVLNDLPVGDELEEYDLLIALDADWSKLSADAIDAIERCVSQRGAGLVFAYGPVNTPRWLREPTAAAVLPLLPVKPIARPLLLTASQRSRSEPQRISLTREGRESPWLWLRSEPAASVAFWEQELPGFYSTAAVEAIKPAATVFARTDPDESGNPRVVFAEQFFGAGRTFYLGAPELWRLRAESPASLRALFTKLLQHLSQGRLLSDSAVGTLVFERDRYSLGETLTLRVALSQEEAPAPEELVAQLELPSGEVQNLTLQPTETPGAWSAGVRAQHEGAYRASLMLPAAGEPLTASTDVRMPALERSRTTRDEGLLRQISERSGGAYYRDDVTVIEGRDGQPPLAELLPSRQETLVVYGAPDEAFAENASRWLLGVIAFCLLSEWTLRRFLNLA